MESKKMYALKISFTKKKNIVTIICSTEIFGLAEWYKIKSKLKPIAMAMPVLRRKVKQAMKATKPGIKSVSEICYIR